MPATESEYIQAVGLVSTLISEMEIDPNDPVGMMEQVVSEFSKYVFEFEIGDEVYLKHAKHDQAHRPNKQIIIERMAQECHGGVQRQYKLIGCHEWYPELVLTREKPAYEPYCDEHLKEYMQIHFIDGYEAMKSIFERYKEEVELEKKMREAVGKPGPRPPVDDN